MTAVHLLCSSIDNAEKNGVSPEEIHSIAKPAWEIHRRSPLLSRIQQWPRRYPGDFETIEHLLRQQSLAGIGSIEYWIEYIALNSSIAQQHRNKVQVQATIVMEAIREADDTHKPNILVMASGSSPDLFLIQDYIKNQPFQLVLNDSDEGAIAYSLSRLDRIADKIQVVPGNVLSSVGKLRKLGPFDLVVAGGLFDYLPDRVAVFLIRNIVEQLLARGGKLFLTNIADGNPYRNWIEYMADWHLIERSYEDMLRLIQEACAQKVDYSITREGTGLTWLVSMQKR